MIDYRPDGFSIVIDTDSYAGNFEREMCGYITSIIGDCEVGRETAKYATHDLDEDVLEWFEEHVRQVPDEHGCLRPVTIAKNFQLPKAPYYSVEIFFCELPKKEIVNIIKDRAKTFCNSREIKYLGTRLLQCTHKVTEEKL